MRVDRLIEVPSRPPSLSRSLFVSLSLSRSLSRARVYSLSLHPTLSNFVLPSLFSGLISFFIISIYLSLALVFALPVSLSCSHPLSRSHLHSFASTSDHCNCICQSFPHNLCKTKPCAHGMLSRTKCNNFYSFMCMTVTEYDVSNCHDVSGQRLW